jgi:hypothetical protein
MRELYNILTESKKNFILSPEDKAKLIRLDKRYNTLIMKVRNDFNEKDVKNLDEEREKFFEARKKGEKYFPIFDLGEMKYNTKLLKDLISLKNEFQKFSSCFLSKYYIQCLNRKINWVNYQIMIHKKFDVDYSVERQLSQDIYQQALEILKYTKYQDTSKLNRTIGAEEAKIMIENALKELDIEWKVIIEDNMLARMNVLPNGILRINKTAKFNDADIEGLIAHEIKGHVLRRIYANKKGLYLFVHGLLGYSILDEGLAIWNSLNLVNKQKPNVMYNIALKYVVAYNKYRMDFCELFDFTKQIAPTLKDAQIFNCIARAKREILNTKKLGGVPDDGNYLYGYDIVNNMDDKQREDILKWNIGPDHIRDISDLKEFFRVNNFEPIKL